jgi:hypothetical protein
MLITCPCLRSNPRFLSRPAHTLASILTDIFRLLRYMQITLSKSFSEQKEQAGYNSNCNVAMLTSSFPVMERFCLQRFSYLSLELLYNYVGGRGLMCCSCGGCYFLLQPSQH